MWQAESVAAGLRAAWPTLRVSLEVIETKGDIRLDVPVWELGGQGVFVKEVQAAVLDGRSDAAVHSAKDMPSEGTPGLDLTAMPRRADPRDALVGARLADLPTGAVVATGSVRRRAQLAWLRPDLTFTGVRGNIGTRLGKVPPGGAVVIAAAALDRLGLRGSASEILSPDTMLPQVGQGAIGLECRADDHVTAGLLAVLEDTQTHVAVTAERAMLAQLGSGCNLPVGAYGIVRGESIELEGLLASIDGRILFRSRVAGPVDDPAGLGAALASELLDGAGGRGVLAIDGAGLR